MQAEFGSAEDARCFRERLTASGAFEGVKLSAPPVVVEEVDAVAW